MSCTITIIEPTLGTPVPVDGMGMINVEVEVTTDYDIQGVYADSYVDGGSPNDPGQPLTYNQADGYYEGQIPGDCNSEFYIIIEVYLQDPNNPMNNYESTVNSGPYTGDCGRGHIGAMGAQSRPSSSLVRFCKKLGIRKSEYYRWLKPHALAPPNADEGIVPQPPAQPRPARRRPRPGARG